MDWTPIIAAITAAVIGIAVISMAVAILLLARHQQSVKAELRRIVAINSALLEQSVRQAEATRALAEETNRDRALAVIPLLVLLDEPPIGIREEPWIAVRVRNVGNGSALNFVVWMLSAGDVFRSTGSAATGFNGALHLAPGDLFETGLTQNMLYVGKEHGHLDPGPAVVGNEPAANLAAYCGDSFGNRYRFNLRTSDPPEVWERGADAPSWAGAWDPRLTSGAWPYGDATSRFTSSPRDLTQLEEALNGALRALQDARVDQDVSVSGRSTRGPRLAERLRDTESRD
jgi:hypothetical protein